MLTGGGYRGDAGVASPSRVSSAGYAGATGFSGSAAAGDRWGASAGGVRGGRSHPRSKSAAVAPPDVD